MRAGTIKKKIARMLLIACILMTELFSAAQVAIASDATRTDQTPIDFVLVLDQSGTMNSSDPDNLTIKAAKMFIDMLPSENARLSVIAFGKDYGEAAFTFEDNSDAPDNKRFVKEIYELSDITSMDSKRQAKENIDTFMEDSGTQTQIGYALEAAYETLQAGASEEGHAAVILMTDGRVTGSNINEEHANDKYNEGFDYHSIDAAVENLSYNSWPVYALELNMDGINDGNSSDGRVGKYQMREVIPTKTGGEGLELKDANMAQDAYAQIFTKFFDAESTVATDSGVITDGQVTLQFDIGEMVAETSVTLTGSVDQVKAVEITDNNGKKEKYERRAPGENREIEEEDTVVVFGDSYITIKLFSPENGDYSVTAYGTDEVEIGLYAVSIREMDLKLSSDVDDGEIFPKGNTATFRTAFTYKGRDYKSSTFYKNHPAVLEIEKDDIVIDSIVMEGYDNYYEASYTFSENGTYSVHAKVEDEIFREGEKESGEYVYQVSNIPCEAKGSIDAKTLHFKDSFEINLTEYFENADHDPIKYTVTTSDTEFKYDTEALETGILKAEVGTVEAAYDVVIEATDGTQETAAKQIVSVSVENQPLEINEELQKLLDRGMKIEFTYNADAVPGFLLNMVNVPKEAKKEIDWNVYCTDPDGTAPIVEINTLESDDTVQMDTADGISVFSADAAGEAEYELIISDAGSSSVNYKLNVTVKSWDAKSLVWKMIRVPFIIIVVVVVLVIALLILAFGGRKIYGIWEITYDGDVLQNKKISMTAAGKKKQCNLDEVLRAFNCPTGFPNVKLAATNNFSKAVIIKGKGLAACQSIKFNNKTKKSSSYKLTKNQSITLVNNQGYEVKLNRKR